VVSRGVENTVRDLEESGHGDIARSWVGRGANRSITPRQLEAALGEDAIRDLMDQTGTERNELLETLSEHLPRVTHARGQSADGRGSFTNDLIAVSNDRLHGTAPFCRASL
jgi:uncharacterized protein YidB (DUF937 family)